MIRKRKVWGVCYSLLLESVCSDCQIHVSGKNLLTRVIGTPDERDAAEAAEAPAISWAANETKKQFTCIKQNFALKGLLPPFAIGAISMTR